MEQKTWALKKTDERILERRGQNVNVDNGVIITVLQTEVRGRAGVDCIMEVVRGKKYMVWSYSKFRSGIDLKVENTS